MSPVSSTLGSRPATLGTFSHDVGDNDFNRVTVRSTADTEHPNDLYLAPAGSYALRVVADGSMLFGRNDLMHPDDAADLSTGLRKSVASVWNANNQRLYLRGGLALTERGDPVDLSLGRTGPNDSYIDTDPTTMTGVLDGEPLGSIYWWGFTTPGGGVPGTSTGGSFQHRSAAIAARAKQDIFSGKAAGQLEFATTPLDGSDPETWMTIDENGLVTCLEALAVDGTAEVTTLIIKRHAQPDTAELDNGDLAFWFDQTAGASRLRFRGKDAAGTLGSTGILLTGELEHDGAKAGFFGAGPAVQRAHVADPSGGGTQDAEARTVINSILVTLETYGFHAAS